VLTSGTAISLILAEYSKKTGNVSPYLDSFTMVFSLLATYLTIKKYSENWLFWIVIDALLCYLFYQQNLSINAFLFLIYTFVAVYGWFKWSKQLK
jgi:nicotinamide mononucleotide transporter